MTTPVTGAGATSATPPPATTAAAGFDKDMFLKLLVAQL